MNCWTRSEFLGISRAAYSYLANFSVQVELVTKVLQTVLFMVSYWKIFGKYTPHKLNYKGRKTRAEVVVLASSKRGRTVKKP